MNPNRLVKILFAALLATACNAPQEPETLPDRIVVIFSPRPEIPNRYDFPGGSYTKNIQPVVLSFRSEKLGEQIPSIDSLRADTLMIPMTARRLIANFRYNFRSTAEMLLHNGDTVLIRMAADSLPQITVTNREAKDADLNFDALRARRYGRLYGFTTVDHYDSRGMFLSSMEPKGYMRRKEICADLSEKYARELTDETPWIDSLHAAGLLSDEARDFYAARNTFRRQMQEIYPIARTAVPDAQSEVSVAEKRLSLLRQYDDSLYRNDFYRYYTAYYNALADKCLGTTKSIETSNSMFRDARDAFDRLDRDTLPLGLLKEAMLTRYMGEIDENFSIDDAKRYYDRLTARLTDTTLMRVVRTRFGAELGHELHKEDDISLVSIGGDTTSMRRVLAENAGKVIYVDFYASWCHPCMEGMPASEQLRKHYAGKEVVFVYLALNDKPEKWRGAQEKARLQGVTHNYLILEPRLSTMIEQLKVQSIPRLLLFGRNGELVHKNAPRPESPEARREIDKLLAGK